MSLTRPSRKATRQRQQRCLSTARDTYLTGTVQYVVCTVIPLILADFNLNVSFNGRVTRTPAVRRTRSSCLIHILYVLCVSTDENRVIYYAEIIEQLTISFRTYVGCVVALLRYQMSLIKERIYVFKLNYYYVRVFSFDRFVSVENNVLHSVDEFRNVRGVTCKKCYGGSRFPINSSLPPARFKL